MSANTANRAYRVVRMLYALSAALLLLGLLFGRYDARRRNRIPLPVRMLSSALVLVCALLLWRGAGARSRRATRLVAGGMGCGFLGDLVLAEVIPLPERVLYGMLTFGAGHGLYMRAFLDRAPRTEAARRYVALGTAWTVALAGWWALVRNPAISPKLNYGALGYALLLSSMSGLAASLAAQDRRYAPLALGGALFFLSDLILASELFRKTHVTGIGDIIWLTYIAGQALIVGTIGLESRQSSVVSSQ